MPLACVGKIIEVKPIDGADRIQQATVVCGDAGKWSGVVGKDIAVNDLVTVFLQDALLPPGNERWAFMESRKWRVRMMRFKGVPSECLILKGSPDLPIGTDLSEALGVTKFEKPIPENMNGVALGEFPSHIPKTDEVNFQTVPELVAKMQTDHWYATEKADGTSCTVYNDDSGMHVCSRRWQLGEFDPKGKSNLYWKMARQYQLDRLPKGLALQFEVVGPGIQGNPMGLSRVEARVFILRDTEKHRNLTMGELHYCCKQYDIPMVRIIGDRYTNPIQSEDQLRAMAEITYANGKPAEGIVIRAMDSSWSFKVLNLLYKD